jgi:ketosteroid isomerase-like protein
MGNLVRQCRFGEEITVRDRVVLAMAVVGGLIAFNAAAEEGSTMTAAHQAVRVFVETVTSGEARALEAILAPEFQILRANGVGYDRKGYLASELPAIDKSFEWRLEDVVATASGDLLVVRYWLVINQTIDGRPTAQRAPRLTVFRRDDDRWLVVAHANFAGAR